MENLPIVEYEAQIITMSKKYPVILISGRMGCAKSTQVPRFLSNDYKSKRMRCNIVVTQPRRLAAMSIAKYVARILNCPIGTQVAYQVGMQQLVKKNVELLYCTTDGLLNKLMSKSLSAYTHIIMDEEVHESDNDVDLTLLVIKKLMISCPTIREWHLRKTSALRSQWARRCLINLKSLQRADELRADLMQRLFKNRERILRFFLLKVALAGAFYPNYFTYDGLNAGCAVDERDVFKTLSSFDPNCTVFLKGLPTYDATPYCIPNLLKTVSS